MLERSQAAIHCIDHSHYYHIPSIHSPTSFGVRPCRPLQVPRFSQRLSFPDMPGVLVPIATTGPALALQRRGGESIEVAPRALTSGTTLSPQEQARRAEQRPLGLSLDPSAAARAPRCPLHFAVACARKALCVPPIAAAASISHPFSGRAPSAGWAARYVAVRAADDGESSGAVATAEQAAVTEQAAAPAGEGSVAVEQEALPELELEFVEPSGGQKAWTSFKLAFAAPWRRVKNGSALVLKLTGQVAEQPQGRFSSTVSLPALCECLKKAALDPRISGVVVKIDPLACGWGKLQVRCTQRGLHPGYRAAGENKQASAGCLACPPAAQGSAPSNASNASHAASAPAGAAPPRGLLPQVGQILHGLPGEVSSFIFLLGGGAGGGGGCVQGAAERRLRVACASPCFPAPGRLRKAACANPSPLPSTAPAGRARRSTTWPARSRRSTPPPAPRCRCAACRSAAPSCAARWTRWACSPRCAASASTSLRGTSCCAAT